MNRRIEILPAKISTCWRNNLTQSENLAAVVSARHRILLKSTRSAFVSNKIVSNVERTKKWKCNRVLDQDGVVFCRLHQCPLLAEWKFIHFNWTISQTWTSDPFLEMDKIIKVIFQKLLLVKYEIKIPQIPRFCLQDKNKPNAYMLCTS